LGNRENKIEIGIIVGLFFFTNIICQISQRPITLNHGQGWDGSIYFQVAEQLASSDLPNANAPFVFRLGTPLLVAIFSKDALIPGFKIVNILANFLSAILFVFLLRQFIRNVKIRIAMSAAFMLMWHGPLRYVFYYPVLTDSWLFVFVLAGLLGIRKLQQYPSNKGFLLFVLISSVGIFFREATILVPIAYLFATNPLTMPVNFLTFFSNKHIIQNIKNIPFKSLLPLFLCGLTYFAISKIVTFDNSYNFFVNAIYWALSKPFSAYLLALFVTFGPIIVLLIYKWRWVIEFFRNNQYLLVFLLAIFMAAWVGGSDTERILFWGAPVIYLVIGKCIEDNFRLFRSIPILITLIAAQSLSMKLFSTIPDSPNNFVTPLPILTILINNFQNFPWFSIIDNHRLETITFIEYALLALILILWLYIHSRQIEVKSS
jgi:hypothetical protein